jgi:hypothetical protein
VGGDPLEQYRRRQMSIERRWFAGAAVVMSALLLVFYAILVR